MPAQDARDSAPVAVGSAIAEPKGEVNRACAKHRSSSLAKATPFYQQPCPNLCVPCVLLVLVCVMDADRIATALARIEAAITRIDAARVADAAIESKAAAGPARVVELVNVHERLREQVAESLRELDDILIKLED